MGYRRVMNPLRLVSPLVAGLSLFSSGCGSDCADVGCSPAALVRLDESIDEPGTYELSVVADGSEMKCTLVLPSETDASCTDQRLTLVGQEDPAKNLSGFIVFGQHESLVVRLSKDAQLVVEAALDLVYTNAANDGAGCGTCPEANVTLAVP